MKNIIVPIDFSEYSLKGLEMAILFAKYTKSNIQMVYVQKKNGEYYPSIKQQQLQYAEEQFAKIEKKYKAKLCKESKLDWIIKQGKVPNEIVNQAQSFKDSMIISSTHGISGWDEHFLGSNATKIIAITNRPVVTINQGSIPKAIKKIVLPIDHTLDTRQKVPFTVKLAKIFKAEIHVVGVLNSDQKDLEQKVTNYVNQVVKALEKEGVDFKSKIVKGNSVAETIINYARLSKAQLISIMTEQGHSISDILLGSQAEKILSKSEIPVLTTTPKELSTLEAFRTQGT